MRAIILLLMFPFSVWAQNLPSRWDEIVAADWPMAMERSARTCILPIGILEKHGPHAPMGSDLIHVREWAARATRQEYAVVFPDFFYGQIYEARHQPGTFALPSRVVWDLLEATCDEIGRNGFDKIVIINGHGGNPNLLRYFVQAQLERKRPYALYFFEPTQDSAFEARVAKLRKTGTGDYHAGETETSTLLYLRPDLVKLDKAPMESGENQRRLPALPNLYTGIWWYASYPNHYAGDASKASKELGQVLTENVVSQLVRALKTVKADKKTLELQQEFYQRAESVGSNKQGVGSRN